MIHGKSLMFDAKEVQLFVYYIGDILIFIRMIIFPMMSMK